MKRGIVAVLAVVLLVAAGAGARHFFQSDRDVTTDSAAAYEAYRQGLDEVRRFRFPEAAELLEKAVSLDEKFAMAYFELGRLSFSLQQRDAAKEYIEKAHALRDHVTEIERLQIDRTYAALNNDRETVESTFKTMVEKYPDHPATCFIRAQDAKQNSDFDLALHCFNKILELDPQRIDIYNQLGYLYLQAGDYEQGIANLKRYAFFAPDLANPHDSLGEAYLHTGRYEESIDEYLASLRIDPTFVNSAIFLSRVLATTGRFEDARDILDKTKSVFEERGWMLSWQWARVNIEANAENWEEVLARLDSIEKLTTADGDEEEGMYAESELGMGYYRALADLELGRTEEAHQIAGTLEALVEKVHGKDADNPRVKDMTRLRRAYLASRFARATDDPAAGVEGLRSAIAQSVRSPHELADFRQELAQALYDAGEYDAAITEGEKLLAAIPTYPTTNLLLAKAHMKEREPQEALRYLTVFVDVMQYADEGNPDVMEARELLKRVVPSG